MKTRILIILAILALMGVACRPKAPAVVEEPSISVQPAGMQKMITAKVFIKPGSETDFISAAKMMIENSNKEEGCLGYMLYQDPYEKTNFIFVETYKNQTAIDAHFVAPYFSEFGTKIADMTSREMEIRIYDIVGEQ